MAASFHPLFHKRPAAPALPVLLLLLGLLASCTTSLYPLSEKESEAVFRPELLGTWEQPKDYGGSYLSGAGIEKGPGALYRITTTGRYSTHPSDTLPEVRHLLARLFPVGDYLFLDCVADRAHPSTGARAEFAFMGTTPVHYLCRVVLRNQNEVVELWELQAGEELRGVLKEKGAAFYAQTESSLLLMEPPARLKKLLVELAREPYAGLWEKKTWLRADPDAAKAEPAGAAAMPVR